MKKKKLKIQSIENNPTIKAKSIFQIILIGDSKVGKTTLIQRILNHKFIEIYNKSTPFNLFWKNYQINNEIYCLQLWDVCGDQFSKKIIGNFYNTCNCVFLLYSIDNIESFNNLKNWLNDLKKYTNDNILIILIGNKIDLNLERKILFNQGKKFQEENNLDKFIEISVKDNINIVQLINYIITTLYYQLKYSTKIYEKLNEINERNSTLSINLRPSTSDISSYLDARISKNSINYDINKTNFYEEFDTDIPKKKRKKKCCWFLCC